MIFIAFEWIIASVYLINLYFKESNKINISSSNDSFRIVVNKFWIFCSPFLMYALVSFAHDFADKWLLQNWGGAVQQAYFGIAF